MSDEFLFTCDECGASFDPDPLAILECGWGCYDVAEDKCEKVAFESGCLTKSGLERMSEYELSEIGMTPTQRDQLLNGEESVDAGTICLCPDCRGRIFDNAPVQTSI